MFAVKAKFNTVVKRYPSVESFDDRSFNLKPEDLPLLVNRMDFQEENGHYETELMVPKRGFFNWYVFAEHVEQTEPPEYYLLAEEWTVVKQRIAPAQSLGAEEKFNFVPKQDQPLQANWIKDAPDKHYEISLIEPVNGVHNWFVFSEHVKPSKLLA